MQTVKLALGETLEYDHETHRYFIDGAECFGTHRLMERYDIVKPMNEFTAPYAARGSRVDVMTNLDDEGDLDETTVDSSEIGYLNAWRLFKKESGAKVLHIQQLVGSVKDWYATTIDRILEIGGKRVTCNIKTGKKYKQHAVQLWLERLLHPADDCIAVYLDATGNYVVESFDADQEAREVAEFLASTNGVVHRWMMPKRKKKAALEPRGVTQ